MADVIDMRQWEHDRLERLAMRLVDAIMRTPDHQLTARGRRIKAECLAVERRSGRTT